MISHVVVWWTLVQVVGGFLVSPIAPQLPSRCPGTEFSSIGPLFIAPPDFASVVTAVEVFDGSTIVDPVVVSDVFWTSLTSKLLTFIVGQLLASLAFGAIITFAGSQIPRIVNALTAKLFDEDDGKRDAFVTADAIKVSRASNVKPDFGKLILCLAIDIIGTSSELIPVAGELTDVIYAPIAAYLLRSLYGGSNVVFLFEFGEEILPFTDILPFATICWVVDTFLRDSDAARMLQLGLYRRDLPSVDVTTTESISEKYDRKDG